jgi:hypothetical protein
MSFIPECDKCGSEKHDGLRPVCDNTEKQEVLNVCDECYKKTKLDATDLMLLQFPELWDNTRKTFLDICYYGYEEPEQEFHWCHDCKQMTSKKKRECCDGCWDKVKLRVACAKDAKKIK